MEMKPIGIIHTPFTQPEGMPMQPAGAVGVKGTVEVEDQYRAGLKDLDGFSHVILLYHYPPQSGIRPARRTLQGFRATRALRHTCAQTSEPDRDLDRATGQDRERCSSRAECGHSRRHTPF